MTALDMLLTGALLLLLPAESLWWSLRPRPTPSRRQFSAGLIRTMRTVTVLLAALFGLWWWEGRSFSQLGLEVPVPLAGVIGLAAAAVILGLLAAMVVLKRQGKGEAELLAGAEQLPQTRQEMMLFVLFALVIGCGWELLYRGYLLWVLPPVVGMPAATVLAAIAYGLGHPTKDWRTLAGAIVSSFLFTIGYASTGSLWWLMLLHIGLPLIGALAMHQARRWNVKTP